MIHFSISSIFRADVLMRYLYFDDFRVDSAQNGTVQRGIWCAYMCVKIVGWLSVYSNAVAHYFRLISWQPLPSEWHTEKSIAMTTVVMMVMMTHHQRRPCARICITISYMYIFWYWMKCKNSSKKKLLFCFCLRSFGMAYGVWRAEHELFSIFIRFQHSIRYFYFYSRNRWDCYDFRRIHSIIYHWIYFWHRLNYWFSWKNRILINYSSAESNVLPPLKQCHECICHSTPHIMDNPHRICHHAIYQHPSK